MDPDEADQQYHAQCVGGWSDEECMLQLCYKVARSLGCMTLMNWTQDGRSLLVKLNAVGIWTLKKLLCEMADINNMLEHYRIQPLIHEEWSTLSYEATMLFERVIQDKAILHTD